MNDKIRCQSCGQPIAAEFKNLGTDANGESVSDFCVFCFRDGDFTNPNQTLDEMIESSIANMTGEQNMPEDKAAALANSFIPTLRRWRS